MKARALRTGTVSAGTSRILTLGLTASCALTLCVMLWVLSGALRFWPIFVVACAVTMFLLGSVAWVLRKIIRWRAGLWLGGYLWTKRTRCETDRPIDLCFAFIDHFEPDWNLAPVERQLERVDRWETAYAQAIEGHTDSDGHPPQHTWFCPVALTSREAMSRVATWPGCGWGEIEYHLHHAPDMSEEEIRSQIMEDVEALKGWGAAPTGRYGFVHGMFALAAGDPRYCNAVNEIDVLLETGCYADFTFPAIGTPAQPRQVNSIYYACSNGKPKPYDSGPEATIGESHAGLLIVPGPMWFGLTPRILDDAAVGPDLPPNPRRISRWLDTHIHVRGRPNWVFISVHSHTAQDAVLDFLFAGALQSLWEALESRFNCSGRRLHYVTAREAYNIIKAAEAGHDGNPNHYRDFEIAPPANRKGSPSQSRRSTLEPASYQRREI